jgi:hypothetical protein
MNTKHKVLDWFWSSRRVIALHPILMYYAIEIGSSLFFSGSSGDLFRVVLDVDLSSLFIVRELPQRV